MKPIQMVMIAAAVSAAVAQNHTASGSAPVPGSDDINEARHMVTHHVQGSITRELLVGKDLRRIYQFTAD